MMIIIALCVAIGVFVARTSILLRYYWFGSLVTAKISNQSEVDVLRHRERYGAYNSTNEYHYEYSDWKGDKHTGTLKGLFLSCYLIEGQISKKP